MSKYRPSDISDCLKPGYDFREPYEKGKHEHVFEEIGMRISKRLGKKNAKVVVLRDCRKSSSSLLECLKQGLGESIEIIDLGMCPTPLGYAAYEKHSADCIAIVTASHVQKDANGIKINFRDQPSRIRALADKTYTLPNKLFSLKVDKLKVVVDPLHGCFGGGLAQRILAGNGYDAIEINGDINPEFPPYGEPDCHNDKNLEDLVKTVINEKADYGMAFDGDGDRGRIVDDKGRLLSENMTASIIAEFCIKYYQSLGINAPVIIVEQKCSNLVREVIENAGGRYKNAKTGRNNIKQAMIDHDAVLGVELSGHSFFHKAMYAVHTGDDGLFAGMLIGKMIQSSGRKLSEIVDEKQRIADKYFTSPEKRVPCKDYEAQYIIEKIHEDFEKYGYSISTDDGIRVEKENTWALFRKSSNEEKCSIVAESDDNSELKKVLGRINEYIDMSHKLTNNEAR